MSSVLILQAGTEGAPSGISHAEGWGGGLKLTDEAWCLAYEQTTYQQAYVNTASP